MTVDVLAILLGAAALLCVSAAASRSKHPFRTGLLSAFCGIAGLGAVNLLSGSTGVAIALNYGTALVSVALGVPGVVTLLLLRGIFFV
ncbi:pro-sigmaK processing inhibitor BofA family protein [Anaerofilum sp. BX8]|uniref:Pro-sigmaK processing inhibitor BofA family protein n=1 Tax=Anaerofilum hominis TaxID=2763016 RepID=A0A923I8Q2_9FIRM|nr:pro-sigmaK processing inhibitor BofA family protein [Anaerofilum hominis]MBC5580318.1 pro-sigmaK processing inhibitor BofA family protein [Anaerofilum hominis]